MSTIRSHRIMIAAAIAVTLGCLAVGAVLYGQEFYVAATGKDTSPGTKEQPLATLEAARDVARKAKAGPHRMVLMPGEYFLDKPLALDARDNGLTIEAGTGGLVTLPRRPADHRPATGRPGPMDGLGPRGSRQTLAF